MTVRSLAIAGLLAAAGYTPAHALVFTTSSPATVAANAPVSFTVSAAQLYNVPLGAYDITATYSSSVLTFNSITFSNALGDPTLFDALTSSAPGAGTVEFADVSLLPSANLATLQTGSTVALVTLNFTALRSGTATLSLSNIVASDANGSALLVPEPGSLVLCLTVIGALPLLRRRAG